MEFYPDERYRHDNKHNKNNSNSKMDCMKLENLMVCPKCHCVVLMKSEKMEYVYCNKCHNTLMVPLVYVITIFQNTMCFPMAFMPNGIPMPYMIPQGPGPVIGEFPTPGMMIPQEPGPIVGQMPTNNMAKPQGMVPQYPMGVGPQIYPYPLSIPLPMNNMPFPLNIDPKQCNNAYMNNMYMNPNYNNQYWPNFTPMDPNYNNPGYNDPNYYNNSNSNKDPNNENGPKDNKVKTPIITKRASDLFD
ncbi:MAG: hypothetical protein Q4B63_01790 [Clostridium perfringens]|nr:hypothetical protein [Clostridium perfringens]